MLIFGLTFLVLLLAYLALKFKIDETVVDAALAAVVISLVALFLEVLGILLLHYSAHTSYVRAIAYQETGHTSVWFTKEYGERLAVESINAELINVRHWNSVYGGLFDLWWPDSVAEAPLIKMKDEY